MQATPGPRRAAVLRARASTTRRPCGWTFRPKPSPTSRWWRGSPAPAGRSARRSARFELAVEHAKVRKQFGQLIGQFQAVQHKLANCLISLDGARLALEAAAEARDNDNPDWRVFAVVRARVRRPGACARCRSRRTGRSAPSAMPRSTRRRGISGACMPISPASAACRARAPSSPISCSVRSRHDAPLPAHDMGPAANAFRKEVRDWLARHWTPEKRAAHLRKPFKDRGWDAEFSKLMGRDGWIGVGWPKQFGGQGRSATEQIAFITEMANAGAPAHAHSTERIDRRAGAVSAWHQGAAGRMAAGHPQRRVLLRARLQRAGGRLRPRRAPHPRRPRRRRLGGQRTEAVVDRRRQGGLHVARGAHRSGGEEARRHQRADGRSSLARRHHPSEPGALRQDLQRAVL